MLCCKGISYMAALRLTFLLIHSSGYSVVDAVPSSYCQSPVMDRQLHRHAFIKWQQADSAICRAISAGSEDTAVAYEASCDKRNSSRKSVSPRKYLSCHCKVCDQMSSAIADYAVHARALWMACLGL